jgi:hypothetical protein
MSFPGLKSLAVELLRRADDFAKVLSFFVQER